MPSNNLEQQILNSQSYTGNGFITTTYRDDSIIKGTSYANESTRVIDVSTLTSNTEYFVLDASNCDCDRVYKLPISVNASSGTVIVNLYEDTDYEAGTTEVLTFINRNRLATTLPSVILALTDTIGTDKGAQLFSTLFGTDSTRQSAGGGDSSSSNALILDPDKKYLFEVIYSEDCTVGYNMEIIEV